MKKTNFLVVIMPLGFACIGAAAQSLNEQNNSSSSVERLRNGGEVPGFFSSPPGVNLLKNAIRNQDGSMTIKAGQQTPEGNELNRKFCESFGAQDVTNESDLTIGSGTLFAGVCKGPVGKHLPSIVQPIPGNGTGRIFLPIPTPNDLKQTLPEVSTRAPLQIVTYPTNGSSAYGQMYYAYSSADFFNMPSKNQVSGVGRVNETAPCSWTNALALGPGSGGIAGYAACIPSLNFVQSVITGCFAGTCSTGYGTVSHY